MPIRNRLFILFLFTATFSFALMLRAAYPPVPGVLIPSKNFQNLAEVGEVGFSVRPLPNSFISAIGIPRNNATYRTVVEAYLQKALLLYPETLVFVPRELGMQRPGIEVFDSEPQELGVLFSKLTQAFNEKKRVVLVMSSADTSHRIARNFLIQLEASAGMKIPTLTLAEIALAKQDEVNLWPTCRASLRDGEGGVFDLGCLILTISRKFQAAQTSEDQSFLFVESEMASENILAIYQAPKGK